MTEYIEKEKLKEALCPYSDTNYAQDMETILRIVDELPAVDVAPVVHGYWIEHIDSYENYCECSVCHYSPDSPLDETPYCPHCGAKMDLE